ncbi:MAG TPA: site-specific integrase [Jatrophihabitantaceae bacterium]|jgi:integrase
MTKPRRRQSGEGGISEYKTKAGPRYLIKYAAADEDGGRRVVLKRGYLTRKAAAAELREQLGKIADGTHVLPNKVTVGEHLAEWLDGLRLAESTVASYRKNVRLHVSPHIGDLRLDQLTGTRLTKLYRQLEQSGRADSKEGGLSARTVRYIHTIVHKGLAVAVRDGRLAVNPADKATPPSAKEAAAPEMHPWTDGQLRAFLDWSKAGDEMYVAWLLLAMTGMRRGEALALQWRDIDFDAGTIAVRRSATLVKIKGQGERLVVSAPKSGKPRVIDVDPQTLAALRAHRKTIGTLSLALARDDAPVLGTVDGAVRHPERFSLAFKNRVARARKELGEDALPTIRLHDLRHTHATILLLAGVPVKVVSERLGHASPMITLTVYAHVMPTMQREAATKLAAMVYGGA